MKDAFKVHHTFLYLKAIFIGVVSGFIVTFYRLSLEFFTASREEILLETERNPLLFIPLILILISFSFFIGWIVEKYPMIKGSGIPQIKGLLRGFFKISWWPELPLKFLGGLMALGSGLSLGREGPSIQLGGLTACATSKQFAHSQKESDFLITAGSAAGLAAAFNAPLSGVLFTFEELRNRLTHTSLVTVILACLSAGIVSETLVGQHPVFSFVFPHMVSVRSYFFLIPLGILCGALAVLFNRSLLFSQTLHSFIKWPLLRPLPSFLTISLLWIFAPLLLGSGHELLQEVKGENFSLLVLGGLIFVKLFLTALCYGSGSPGGIFLPLLIIGAIIGKSYEMLLIQLFDYPHIYGSFFIALGMAAFFSGVTKAPITGCVLILEMTASLNQMIPLIIVALVAYGSATFMGGNSIYDELLERILFDRKKKGINPDREVG